MLPISSTSFHKRHVPFSKNIVSHDCMENGNTILTDGKHLPKGESSCVAADFPKQVDEIRKELYYSRGWILSL